MPQDPRGLVPAFVLREARQDFRKIHPWISDESIAAYYQGVDEFIFKRCEYYIKALKARGLR